MILSVVSVIEPIVQVRVGILERLDFERVGVQQEHRVLLVN